jgi:hypothetical protein
LLLSPGRPRKPNYCSIRKVLDAIRFCSCGKWEKERKALRRSGGISLEFIAKRCRCSCVGPKSWTQLLTLTGLHRNTLSRTCSYLVKRNILERKVAKVKGHHVTYSITKTFLENPHLRLEMMLRARKRNELFRKPLKKLARAARFLKPAGFEEYYAKTIQLLKTHHPETDRLPLALYYYLVKMVHLVGYRQAIHILAEQLQHLGPSGLEAVAAWSVYGRRMLRRGRISSQPPRIGNRVLVKLDSW